MTSLSGVERSPDRMVGIDAVSMSYRTARNTAHLALQDITLSVAKGELVSIVGPSGCGKSTLLYIVGGFIRPTAGSVTVEGRVVDGPGPDRGPVFQEFALFPWKSVLANVMSGLLEQGVGRAAAKERAARMLALVNMDKYRDFYPRELSGGMKQRVAIARTLAYEPSILLMDEPFGSLDLRTRMQLQIDLLTLWERDRKTVLFVTHGVEEAVFLSDKVFVMTGSPGRGQAVITVDLPRPRVRRELLLDRRFQEHVVHIEGLLEQ
jgi:NitT/TauT family transport system ATP-binding protein